uniref:Uncharacterized protein n=1 Tax=Mycena chlorophos TaxID=658473 RepID=A0ABQ0M1I6_MYCCL|nr:predicted protein [Mycena chlorophos]
MHSAFSLSNLQRLPSGIRDVARRLAGNDPLTAEDLAAFHLLQATPRETLLPLYWKLLDPAQLPQPDALDNPSEHLLLVLEGVTIALKHSFRLAAIHRNSDSGAGVTGRLLPPLIELWDRLFAWVAFIAIHFAALPVRVDLGLDEKSMLWSFLSCSNALFEPSKLVSSTD